MTLETTTSFDRERLLDEVVAAYLKEVQAGHKPEPQAWPFVRQPRRPGRNVVLRPRGPTDPAPGRLRPAGHALRRARETGGGGFLRPGRTARVDQGGVRPDHAPLRPAGQPRRGGVSRRRGPAGLAPGRLRPAHPGFRPAR